MNMTVADKQLIAISRAILQDAQLVIMDEPTTALTEREVEALLKVIRN
jgi:simple sugar transport system ATP-binding protein